MYMILAQHTEAVNLMRGSALVPTRMPEVINLKQAAFAVDYNHKQLTRVRTTMPGLLRGHSLWNFIIREEAMEKFRMYFRLGHILGVQTTKEEQEQYFCSVPPTCSISFASHEYRVVYLTYGGLAKSWKGNWQWDSSEARYGGEVVGKGFFFYGYGMITIDETHGVIAGPEFLKDADARRQVVYSSTAPSPLSALKSDFARQRVEQDAEMFTKGTMADLMKKDQREKRKKLRKEAKAKASLSSAPADTSREEKEDSRGKVLSSPGVEDSSSDSSDNDGAQDEQDRATEGPLGARKIAKYSPYHKVTNSQVYDGGTMRPTGSDVRWTNSLGLSYGTGNELVPNPFRGRYICPCCDIKFHLSESLGDHMFTIHGMGLEPNYCNEYSVGELVSAINNLATEEKPMSLDVEISDHVVNHYRKVPNGQLSTDQPARDLSRRFRPMQDGEPEVEPPTTSRPLIPVAMTSKLWWTKMMDPADERERRNSEPAEAPVEESFSNMSQWRNLVRAWEMRNHEKLQTDS
eukprot:1844350-Amphidinium_carterae.1